MVGRAAVLAALALAGLTAGQPAVARAGPAPPIEPPPPALAPPPDLVRLEQAMLSFPLTSERFSASETVSSTAPPRGPFGSFSRALAHAAGSFALITVSGEESFVPPLASFHASFLGLQLEGRLIGTTLYVYLPFVSRLDGHRPWVEVPNQHLEQAVGVEVGTLGGKPGSPATQAFGGLVEELAKARSIRELGARTVDGRATTGFEAIVGLAALGTTSASERRTLAKLVQPLIHIEVFIAEDGIPVRTIVRLALRERHERHHSDHTELTVQTDLLAVNVPVVVVPPPADQTITQAALDRLTSARAKRLARARRRRAEGPRSLTG